MRLLLCGNLRLLAAAFCSHDQAAPKPVACLHAMYKKPWTLSKMQLLA